ncbi:MAG: tripartite tricarboxylate transporter substrate binding protein [Propionibacteriales bacterium]|nr:tripartite tricarboxylate transporter substrate binding protein [Propionibacteriales bacterium]
MGTKLATVGVCFTAALALAACGGTGGSGGGAAEENYPEEPLEWTVAFGPGGGNDIMSRQIVDILEKEDLYPDDITVENVDGGSGALGWGRVFADTGNPYAISSTSGSFLTTPLQADTPWQPGDFTHIGLLATDASLFLTSKKSGLTTWEQWVDYAKNKGKVAVGGIGVVNVDLILHAELAKQAGYEMEYVPFNEEGQLITGLSSGSLDAITSNPAEVLGQIESGDMNALLFTGDEPMPGLEEVPTAKSKGYTRMVTTPRGIILAPDAPEEARQWWIDTIKEVVQSPDWQNYLDENNLTADERWGDDFTQYVEKTSSDLETRLTELGAL